MLLIYTVDDQVVSEVLRLAEVDDDELLEMQLDDCDEAVDDDNLVGVDDDVFCDNDVREVMGLHILDDEDEDIAELDEMLMVGLVVENDENDLQATYLEYLMYMRLDDDEIRIVPHPWLDELELELDDLDNIDFDVMLQIIEREVEEVDTIVVVVLVVDVSEYLYYAIHLLADIV